MKIAIVVEIINYHSGARAPLEIAKHLAKRGNNIIVFAYVDKFDKETMTDLKKNKCEVELISYPPVPFFGKYLMIPWVSHRIHHYSPQVMYFSGTLPFFLAGKLAGMPVVQMYQGTQLDAYLERKTPDDQTTLRERLINKLVNNLIYLIDFVPFRFSKSVIAVSKYAAVEGEKLYAKTVDDIIYEGTTLLPNIKKGIKKRKNCIDIISVSRITPYKGFHHIIKALKNVDTKRNVFFTIAGSQPKRHYVEYLKKIGGEHFRIIINPSDRILAKLYQTSDIYVNADRYLYFGLPVMEAAGFGKPTVSLNLAAANELIAHGKTGYVANDLTEFSYYLQKLIEDERLRKKLGYNALQWSKKFSWEKCAKKWERVLLKYAKQS